MCGSEVIINQCRQFGVDEISAAEVVPPSMRFDDVDIADGRSDDEVEWVEDEGNVDDNAEGDNNPDVFWWYGAAFSGLLTIYIPGFGFKTYILFLVSGHEGVLW